MAARLFLALAVLIGLMWLIQWLSRATPQQRSNMLKMAIVYGGVGILLLLVATGRIHWLFAAIGALIPWLQRYVMAKQAWTLFKSAHGPTPGQTSEVNSRFLRMTLDHDSGDLDGEILKGRHRGSRLSGLNQEQLQGLWREYRRQDAQSAQLLEAYLDRIIGHTWRENIAGEGAESDSDPTSPNDVNMTQAEACKILGVEPGAERREIIDAHRRLMQKLHPDRGGNDYLAAKINQAKDVLLRDV